MKRSVNLLKTVYLPSLAKAYEASYRHGEYTAEEVAHLYGNAAEDALKINQDIEFFRKDVLKCDDYCALGIRDFNKNSEFSDFVFRRDYIHEHLGLLEFCPHFTAIARECWSHDFEAFERVVEWYMSHRVYQCYDLTDVECSYFSEYDACLRNGDIFPKNLKEALKMHKPEVFSKNKKLWEIYKSEVVFVSLFEK